MAAEISLRSYLRKIENLIQEGAIEEAVAHCRRILEYYPRNALAYRLLGQALVQRSRWQEAAEIFRRLLSALPTDFIAHEQLSLVYEKLKQPDQAIFHLERAFEAQPNNKHVINRLRELYATHRGVQVEKIQLTAGALAGQYINRNMNEQAVAILQAALQRSPNRPDLKLQLARALWNVGQTVEAAEVAIEVLNELPYALPANRILTELWLQEQRPSDAQRYLSRIEDVDPYLAIRIATGENVSPETFMLPELDYAEYARQAISAQRPDWLESVEQEAQPAADGDDWLQALETEPQSPPKTVVSPRRVTDTLSNLLPETGALAADNAVPDDLPSDVKRRLDLFRDAAAEATVAAPAPTPDSGDDWMKELGIEIEDAAPEPPRRTGLTGRLSRIEAEAQQPEEDDSWLMDLPDFVDETPAQPTSAAAYAADDFFAASGFELADDKEAVPQPTGTGLTDLLGAMDESDDLDLDDDDLEWLNADDAADAAPAPTPAAARPANDSTDMFAWMRESGIELDENAPDENPLLNLASDFDDADLNLTPASSTDWMRAEGIELVEEAASQAAEDDEFENPLAWLSDADDDALLTDAAPSPPVRAAAPPIRQAAPPPAPIEASSLSDDSALEEMLELESLMGSGDFLSDTAADTAGMEAPAVPVDWQEMMPDDTPNWQSDDMDDADLESMDWLSDDDLLAESDTDDAQSFDFFAEPKHAAPQSAAPIDFFAEPADDELVEDDAMAWLTDDDLLAEDTDAASASQAMAEAEEPAMAWLSDDLLVEDDDLPAEAEEPAMAWLSDDLLAEDTDAASASQAMAEAEEPAMAWLSEDNLLDDADLISGPASTLPTDLFAADSQELDFAADEDAAAPDFLPVDTSTMDEDEPLEEPAMAWLGEDDMLDADEMAELDAIPFASAEDDEIDYLTLSDQDAHELAESGLTTASGWLDDAVSDDALLEDLASDEFDGDDLELADEFAAGMVDESNVPTAAADFPASITDMTTEWDADDDEMAFAWDKFDDQADALESAVELDAAFDTSDEDAALLDVEEDVFGWADGDAAIESEPAWLNSLSQPEEQANSDFTPLTVQTPLAWQDESADDDDFMADDDLALMPLDESDDVSAEDLDWMVDADVEDADVWDDAEETPSPTAGMTNLLNNLEANRYDLPADEDFDELVWDTVQEETEDDLLPEAAPDWLAAASADDALLQEAELGDDSALDDEFAGIHDDEFALSEEEANWLSDLDGVYDDEASLLEGTRAELEWQPETDLTDDDFAAAEEADWLSEIQPAMPAAADDELELVNVDALDWGDSDDSGLEWQPETELPDDAFAAAEEPDWLSALQPESGTTINSFAEPAAELMPEPQLEDAAGPDWLAILNDSAAADSDREVSLPAAPLAEMPEVEYSSDNYEEEILAVPASNAPDWLNAMVPGLDLDYQANGEDALAAPDVAPEIIAARDQDKYGYGWLQAIVDEETSAMEAAPVSPPLLPQPEQPSLKRFVFSRLPAWMRPAGTAQPAAAAAGSGVIPDYLAEFDREYNANTSEAEFADLDDFDFDDDFNK